MYLAVSMKILALPINKSPLSMPGPLGLAPTRRAYYESLKPLQYLYITITLLQLDCQCKQCP